MGIFGKKIARNYTVLVTIEYMGEVIKEIPMVTKACHTGRQARIDLQSNLVMKVGKAYKKEK